MENTALSSEQKSIISGAINLLSQYDKETVRGSVYYGTVDGNGDIVDDSSYSEYDTCNSDECMESMLKQLHEQYPSERFSPVHFDNGRDHDNMQKCYVCSTPISESLTWIEQELEHHIANTPAEEYTNSLIAFELRVLFEAVPSSDEDIGGYEKYQMSIGNPIPMEQTLRRQRQLIKEVVRLAKYVVKTLRNIELLATQ